MNFFSELKRRNVYKVAVAYGVVGWLVMQVAATIVPALHLPESLTTAVVVLVLLGFPIALVIAWAFEMTPEGMKRTENISPNDKLPQWSVRKFVAVFATLALIAAGLLVFQKLRSHAPAAEIVAAAEKSIAVLPFLNQSGDPNDEYFSDGLSEELISALAQIDQLKAKLTQREGRTVKLTTKVDPDLLGGLVVTIGSKRIDGSIRTRLNSLAQAMKG